MELSRMTGFLHRGVPYFADDMERIFNADGKLLGYICSRGSQYGWGALVGSADSLEDTFEFARGNGVWEPMEKEGESPDPAMDALLHAHMFRCGVCEGRGKVKINTHSDSVKVECTYCGGTGVIES